MCFARNQGSCWFWVTLLCHFSGTFVPLSQLIRCKTQPVAISSVAFNGGSGSLLVFTSSFHQLLVIFSFWFYATESKSPMSLLAYKLLKFILVSIYGMKRLGILQVFPLLERMLPCYSWPLPLPPSLRNLSGFFAAYLYSWLERNIDCNPADDTSTRISQLGA